ncbi:MAG: YigZ family protein [Bacteroidetes bacterium 4572_112]|nr:MAG: YigZ family protein [Bacteroidetes bacterium 4572_112]
MSETDLYHEIKAPSESLFKDRGSKFIAKAYPVYSEEEVKEALDILRKEYYDARHHCYSYILGADKKRYRINDDGEPSGSAGKPIHGQLLSHDLTNILVVVIRYFGGTKLGIPGLINAYKTATREAIANTDIVAKTVNDVYSIEFEYPMMQAAMKFIKDEPVRQLVTKFEISCYIEISVRKSESENIFDKLKAIYGLKTKLLREE